MYGDTEIKDDNLELSQLRDLLEAAQVFQIEDFRKSILKAAVKLVASKHGAHLSPRIHESYWDEAERLCGMAEVKDWNILRGIADKLPTASIRPNQAWLLRLARESDAGLLAALLLERCINIANKNICSPCQNDYEDGILVTEYPIEDPSAHGVCEYCGDMATQSGWIQEKHIREIVEGHR
ncbi:hypothetical protein AOL_s00110g206 [Orbilia oligospora ATCC 24927]|uniref:Uncharacterized protein n=1 Tax=Arthrobotrys oligospora (strain ATCC 24927 / CBS 115.81 / DSM 1491) TaxID=756982 RepID=G1XL36_ARTOA|nr:hypothetical protein AOL_s00110g206 [Orbilia oligospora ATCC 24927]EGX46042.1 hypothetical protein AOL_s00110g206 [Orbilia oligospora ATCC 24927]